MNADRMTSVSIASMNRKFTGTAIELELELLVAVGDEVEEDAGGGEVVADDERLVVETGAPEPVVVAEEAPMEDVPTEDDCALEVDEEEEDTPEPEGPTETTVTVSGF